MPIRRQLKKQPCTLCKAVFGASSREATAPFPTNQAPGGPALYLVPAGVGGGPVTGCGARIGWGPVVRGPASASAAIQAPMAHREIAPSRDAAIKTTR